MKSWGFKLFICILLYLAVIPARSQLRYGFRFGGDFASASLKNADEFSLVNRSGFTGGLMLEYQFSKCGFAPDIAVVYSRHNTRLKTPDGELLSFGRNFIDIPLHLKYKFWLKSFHELFGPMVYTGPVLSVRLDQSRQMPMSPKRLQPGWDVGIGIDIINFIQLTGGYRFGLGNAIYCFEGMPNACLKTDSWHFDVNIIFDF